MKKTMTVLVALLAVGFALGTRQPPPIYATNGPGPIGQPVSTPTPPPNAPKVDLPARGNGGGGVDAGYILQVIVGENNGTMYGPAGYGSYSMGFQFIPQQDFPRFSTGGWER